MTTPARQQMMDQMTHQVMLGSKLSSSSSSISWSSLPLLDFFDNLVDLDDSELFNDLEDFEILVGAVEGRPEGSVEGIEDGTRLGATEIEGCVVGLLDGLRLGWVDNVG